MKLGLHIHPPSKVKQHTLAAYIKEQNCPKKSARTIIIGSAGESGVPMLKYPSIYHLFFIWGPYHNILRGSES